ncbi:MAG: hypothetical protein ACPGTO_10300 [Polaribacter sp.]
MSETTQEIIKDSLRKRFDENANWWQVQNAKDVIKAAKELGFVELAKELENDL